MIPEQSIIIRSELFTASISTYIINDKRYLLIDKKELL